MNALSTWFNDKNKDGTVGSKPYTTNIHTYRRTISDSNVATNSNTNLDSDTSTNSYSKLTSEFDTHLDFDSDNNSIEDLSFTFSEENPCILKTDSKPASYKHLSELISDKDFDIKINKECVQLYKVLLLEDYFNNFSISFTSHNTDAFQRKIDKFFVSFKCLILQLVMYKEQNPEDTILDEDKYSTILSLFKICVLENSIHTFLQDGHFVKKDNFSLSDQKAIDTLNRIFNPCEFIPKNEKKVSELINLLPKPKKIESFGLKEKITVKRRTKSKQYSAISYILYNLI
ncbi:hypothetical protein NGRA_0293 [Nosema granulosis]|uniref:Uncharacterized protein n=1 Tax=Nosema granulosis TaxID=83296 RepID=A0A9P6H0L5_9MICR|nr:hypothetical protein NGRA_0293 [Nosema granulosis]